MKPIIKVKNISKNFGQHKVLNDVSFEVNQGQVIAIIGPSGSGKTTLLKCINYLINIDAGSIEVENFILSSKPESFDFQSLRRSVGMVFQMFNLWPHKTVIENIIEAPISVLGVTKANAISQAESLLKRINLSEKANEYPTKLSGGQQQRVAIIRALAMNPKILLLDEITSALDPELTWEVLSLVKEIVAEKKQTILLVTHEIGFAKEVADQIIFMDNGKILEQGETKKMLSCPEHQRTKKFIEHISEY